MSYEFSSEAINAAHAQRVNNADVRHILAAALQIEVAAGRLMIVPPTPNTATTLGIDMAVGNDVTVIATSTPLTPTTPPAPTTWGVLDAPWAQWQEPLTPTDDIVDPEDDDGA